MSLSVVMISIGLFCALVCLFGYSGYKQTQKQFGDKIAQKLRFRLFLAFLFLTTISACSIIAVVAIPSLVSGTTDIRFDEGDVYFMDFPDNCLLRSRCIGLCISIPAQFGGAYSDNKRPDTEFRPFSANHGCLWLANDRVFKLVGRYGEDYPGGRDHEFYDRSSIRLPVLNAFSRDNKWIVS